MTVLLQHRGACALRAGEPWQRARRRHGEAFLLPWPLCWGAHWPHELGGPFPSSYLRWRWQRQPSRLSPAPQGHSRRLARVPRGAKGAAAVWAPRPGAVPVGASRGRPAHLGVGSAWRLQGLEGPRLPLCLPVFLTPSLSPPPSLPDSSLAPTEPGGLCSEVLPPRPQFPDSIMQVEAPSWARL